MICRCKNCGGSIEWKIGDAAGVCRDCGAVQEIDKSDIYETAGRLSGENTEESLEQAMLLYQSIKGWQDADVQYRACRVRLGRMRWLVESAELKELEERFEAKMACRRKIVQALVTAVLLCLAVTISIISVRLTRYNRAAEHFTAGEFERSAAEFQEMGNFLNSRARVYRSAVELYKAGRYEEALPYLVWLDGDYDNGYYLNKCRERLAERDAGVSQPEQILPLSPAGSLRSVVLVRDGSRRPNAC